MPRQPLQDRTAEARAADITGIPTVAIGGELLWGDHRLEDAASLLSGSRGEAEPGARTTEMPQRSGDL
jgi:hypothetical protein